MKYRALIGVFTLIFWTGSHANHLQVNLDDILLLNQRGISEQTLLLFLENRQLAFNLDADAIDKLLAAGVSEKVIRSLVSQATSQPDIASTKEDSNQKKLSTRYVSYPVYPPVITVAAYPYYYYAPYYFGYSYSYGHGYLPHAWYRHHYNNRHFASHSDGSHAGNYFGHVDLAQHNSGELHTSSNRHIGTGGKHSGNTFRHSNSAGHNTNMGQYSNIGHSSSLGQHSGGGFGRGHGGGH